ncbi:MAG TPA: crossover junction endodeoxyribonuclease RuvC [Longimicrobiales bacterium]|nr:crossover junction endodeoxyribonuclease RuvC [Longimicrobiales bacterium]
MKVLGVDPGTAATGYGVVVRKDGGAVSLLECGVIRTSASAELPVRLREIHAGLAEVLERHRPDVVAVESVFYGKNVRTTVLLGHARGVVLLAAAEREVEVADYSPAEIKSAIVGTGRGTKDQIQFMVKKLLRLKEAPTPADAADGVAVALCHVNTGRLAALAKGRAVAGGGG